MNAAAKDGSANWAVAPGRDTRTVRADLLRYLITGGCDGCKVHDLGVQLKGAYVLGLLDLNYAQAKGATRLGNCHFEQIIVAQYCRFSVLSLEGSNLQNGMNAQGAETVGSVHLRNMVSAEGGVALNSAKIGGQLACENAQFFVDKGTALQLHNIQVAEFYWRDIASITGRLDLSGAHFDTLVDDPESWDKVSDLILIGLTYDHISSPGDTGKRLEWLNKGDTGNGEFSPQPYTQLAKVLRNMGHDRDARKILIEGETRHQRSGWKDLEKRSDERPGQYILNAKDRLRVWGLKAWSFTLRRLIGYGYKPFNSLWALVFLTLLASGISHKAWKAGDFAPNSDVILSTPEWKALASYESGGAFTTPAQIWSASHGRDYETFNPLAYGFDVVVPIVNIGQEAAWAPSTTRGPWGWNLWWMRWLFTVFGWIVTALGAAAIAGVIRRE